ncbi:M56 family metallopeptidase [Dysosmobacter sp. Phy]
MMDTTELIKIPTADPLEAPMAIATIVWLTGAAAMVLYGAVSLVRLRQRLVGAVPLERGVYLADHIDTPFVLGLFRPKIYLPSALPEGERGYILLHERNHIRRLDHAVKLLAFLALCIHWFNPLVWLMFVLLGRDMEMSCDEAVMRKLGEAVRADYSASLLRLATGRKIIAGAPLAFGEGDTRDRVVNVLKWKRPRLWAVLAGAVVCAAVIAACAVNPGEDSGEAPGEMAGTYASMEDYAQARIQEILDSNSVTYAIADEGGAYTGRTVTDTVEDARGEVTFLGSLEGLDPEGRLEAWVFSWEIKPTNAQNHSIFIAGGGGVLEDGFCDFDQSDLLVVRCCNDDGRYEILWQETAPEHIDFSAYRNSYEEALYDWYVTEYGLDLPVYVEDWIDRVEVPEGGSLGNFPVHRFDGDGWYLYIPVSAWEQVLTEDPDAQWQWASAYGTGATLLVEQIDASLEDHQAALEGQGFVPEDGGKLVWGYPGGNIRCWLYETSDGCLRVTTDYDSSRITDYPYIAMQPQVLTLMAESFTLDFRVTAAAESQLFLDGAPVDPTEPFTPSEDEVLAARELVLEGMSEQEAETLTLTMANVNLYLESLYMRENIFGVLSDPNALYWNCFHETGEIQIGWAVDGDVDMEAVCQQENLSEQEFYEEYGTPVVMENQYDADDFIALIEKLKEPVQNDALKADLQEIMELMELAKNTHVIEYVNSMYKKIHDLDYFLLRYGPTDVGPYVEDDSTITKYYDTLSIYQ